MTFIASIEGDPPGNRDFDNEHDAIVWARLTADGAAWAVGELRPDQSPRLIASAVPDAASNILDLTETGGEHLAREWFGNDRVAEVRRDFRLPLIDGP